MLDPETAIIASVMQMIDSKGVREQLRKQFPEFDANGAIDALGKWFMKESGAPEEAVQAIAKYMRGADLQDWEEFWNTFGKAYADMSK
jgi:hypothetical protein